MALDLETLGMTQEQLQDRVVETLCEKLLTGNNYDPEYDEEVVSKSSLRGKLDHAIKAKIDDAIEQLADARIKPGIVSYIENLSIQRTTGYGEKKGDPMSFIEYLTGRAEAYLSEKVDGKGKTKGENYYDSKSETTRAAFLVGDHLMKCIEAQAREAMIVANKTIVGGIEEAVKQKLSEVSKSLTVIVGEFKNK